MKFDLSPFVMESNRIEGILPTTQAEVDATTKLVSDTGVVGVRELEQYIEIIAPHAQLRDKIGLDVQISDYRPTLGGPHVRDTLVRILKFMGLSSNDLINSYLLHKEYENLHPWTDGNGRSGRALWLRQIYWNDNATFRLVMKLGFLHIWYYHSFLR